jgi:hypothetical protein
LTPNFQISNPSQGVISKSAFIVGEIFNSRNYVRQVLASIAKMTDDLLLVSSCRVHNSNSNSNSSNGLSVAGLMEQVGKTTLAFCAILSRGYYKTFYDCNFGIFVIS